MKRLTVVLLFGLAGCESLADVDRSKIEAPSTNVTKVAAIGLDTVYRFCDGANLVYVHYGNERGGIFVLPGGCSEGK